MEGTEWKGPLEVPAHVGEPVSLHTERGSTANAYHSPVEYMAVITDEDVTKCGYDVGGPASTQALDRATTRGRSGNARTRVDGMPG